MQQIKTVMTEWYEAATKMQIKYSDKKHVLKNYNIKNLILLLIKNLKQWQLNRKLSHKFIRSF